jgi:hypothetical protein
MNMHDLFEPKIPSDPAKVEQIRGWVSERLKLGKDDVIVVSELRCMEPGCPPLETVIAIMAGADQRQPFKLHKGVADISAEDIEGLLAGEE